MSARTEIKSHQIKDLTIKTEDIDDNAITEAKLDTYNSPIDDYVLAWNDTQSKFEWIANTILKKVGITSTIDQSYTGGTSDWLEVYGNRRGAQKFTAGISGSLEKVEIDIKKDGSPNNLIVGIYTKNEVSGYPETELASEEVSAGGIGTAYSWITVTFTTAPTLSSGTEYFIVIYQKTDGGDASNSYWWRGTSGATGAFWSQNAGSSWGALGGGFNYKTYVIEGLSDLINNGLLKEDLSVASGKKVGEIYFSSGNVGIGTPTPDADRALHIKRTGAVRSALKIEAELADPIIDFTANNSEHWMIGIDYSDGYKFKIDRAEFPTATALTIKQTGEVGIGTANPTEKLEVVGNIKAKDSLLQIQSGANIVGLHCDAFGALEVTEETGNWYRDLKLRTLTTSGAIGLYISGVAIKDDAGVLKIRDSGDANYAKLVAGDIEATGELKIKVYSQISEPVLDADSKLALWIDTDDSNRVYLVFRRGLGDQVSVELA